MIVDYDNQEIISTHSLTRRLTIRPPFLCSVWKHFNSQPHKEADLKQSVIRLPQLYFNSQPHKEADVNLRMILNRHCDFNSQPHKEADTTLFRHIFAMMHFNSQPHKEADQECTERL